MQWFMMRLWKKKELENKILPTGHVFTASQRYYLLKKTEKEAKDHSPNIFVP